MPEIKIDEDFYDGIDNQNDMTCYRALLAMLDGMAEMAISTDERLAVKCMQKLVKRIGAQHEMINLNPLT